MKKTVVFIINPKAGTKKKNISHLIDNVFDNSKYEIIKLITEYAGHAQELAKTYSQKGVDIIVAVGGDGTINEVVNGIGLNETALGIVAFGSGNGLARHLKLPLNPLKALKTIEKGKSKICDLIDINGRYSINVSGIGFDANIAHKFHTLSKRGLLTYLKITFKDFFKFKSEKFEIVFDNKTIKKDVFLLAIANSKQFGNNIEIAPQASINDGLIDIVIITPFPKLAIFSLLFYLFTKQLNRSSFVEVIKTKKITVLSANKEIISHIDGEATVIKSPLKASIKEKSFKIIVD